MPRAARDSSGITVDQNPPNDCISNDSDESFEMQSLGANKKKNQSLSTSREMNCQRDFNFKSGASDWLIPTLTCDDLVLL